MHDPGNREDSFHGHSRRLHLETVRGNRQTAWCADYWGVGREALGRGWEWEGLRGAI
jgi:hypothetical protein